MTSSKTECNCAITGKRWNRMKRQVPYVDIQIHITGIKRNISVNTDFL